MPRTLGCGKTDTGKSWEAYYQIYKKSKHDFIIYIDPKPSDYIIPVRRKGVMINSLEQLSKNAALLIKEGIPDEIILKPHLSYEYEVEADKLLKYIIQQKIAGNEGSVLIIIDEAHRFGNKHKLLDVIGKLVKEGESHGIDTVLLTQHAVEIADIVILDCEYFYIYGDNPIMITYAEKKMKIEFTKKDKAWLREQYHGIWYDYHDVYYIKPSGEIIYGHGTESETEEE